MTPKGESRHRDRGQECGQEREIPVVHDHVSSETSCNYILMWTDWQYVQQIQNVVNSETVLALLNVTPVHICL